MSKTYFISDTHFGHAKIIDLCSRPFKTVEEMDETLIKNWNDKVAPNDIVYHLGDFSFRGKDDPSVYFNRLNGQKYLIKGNHDESPTFNLNWRNQWFYREIKQKGHKVVLFHFPILEWNQYWRDSLHFYGHVHNASQKGVYHKNAINLSVEMPWMNYTPRSFEELYAEIQSRDTSQEKV